MEQVLVKPVLQQWCSINEWLLRIHSVVGQSVTVSGTGGIEAASIEAAGSIEAAAAGISLRKDRTILAYVE